MTGKARIAIGAAAAVLLAGCASRRAEPVVALPKPGQTYQVDGQTLTITGMTALPSPGGAAVAAPVAPAGAPAQFQYLYGSGEGAAISVQAWNDLVRYVRDTVKARPADSVVLAPGATLSDPRYVACGAKPYAAVFDVDETVLLNLGFEYDAVGGRAFDQKRWDAWERTGMTQVAAVPGAKMGLDALRAMGVTVVFNTNRAVGNAAQTKAAIEGVGLGPARHGETLFLAGDDAGGSKKDGRRATIARRYCVIAMGGDQLTDFSDLFNVGLTPGQRRAAVMAAPIAGRWGAGWFVLPNPVYGSALKGGVDDIFPPAVRWTPAGEQ